MIELPDKKKCYNLPEQVAQNLRNITFLAEQYKNIDALPVIWQTYKEEFDRELETFGEWTTTFEGWTESLSTYLANMSSAAVGAIAGQNIAPANVAASGILTATHAKILENIEDSASHKRFLEGDVNLAADAPAGITKTYGKWSLSGTHLMFVLAGTIANGTVLSWGVLAACAGMPQWVLDKIFPMTDSYVDRKDFEIFADNLTTQTLSAWLRKTTVLFISVNALTLSADRSFRISFDLLIDNA